MTTTDPVQTLTQAQVQTQLAALLPELILEPEPTLWLLLYAEIGLAWVPEAHHWLLRGTHPTRGVQTRVAWGLAEVTHHIERLALWVLREEEGG